VVLKVVTMAELRLGFCLRLSCFGRSAISVVWVFLGPVFGRGQAPEFVDEPECKTLVSYSFRVVYWVSMWEMDLSLVEGWLKDLDQESYEQVVAALEILKDQGPLLGRPLVDTVKSSRHRNMKELRPGSSGWSELRVLFAFDPERRAILLVAGDKSGEWESWYRVNIPIADDRFDEHLQRLEES